MSDSAYNKLTREEQAELEVGTTTVTPRLRRALITIFLLTIVAVPLVQHGLDVRARRATPLVPKAAEAVRIPADAWEKLTVPGDAGAWARIQAANTRFMRDVQTYEKNQEDESFLAVAAIPPTQALTAGLLGLGNEQVYVGRDGWLFYQPEVGYLTGEGFLNKAFLRARSRSGHAGEEVQPDPLKGILHFRDQLAARGVRLVLMPMPVKPMIEPEHLSARYAPQSGVALQNPSYPAFLKALDEAGVDYLDISAALAAEKRRTGRAQYLKTDTHWTPEAMELGARKLVEKLGSLGITAGPNRDWKRGAAEVTATGDIAAMLKLPATSRLYPAETVTIHPVANDAGGSWSPSHHAGVLVLGDSFTNIYSLEAMGWGKSAGFVEQLAVQLGGPVDAILRNDAAAHATRELLARELAQGRDRLAGKKIVVWEFAMRELSVGDWKLIQLPAVPARVPAGEGATATVGAFYAPADGADPVRVTATVTALAKHPRPGSVPYKDHIFAVQLSDVSGTGVPAGSRAMVYLWSMSDNVLTPASGWKAGDRVTLTLKSWADVAGTYERFNRGELDDDALQLETPCWGEPAK